MPLSSLQAVVIADRKRTFLHRHFTKLTITLAAIVWGVFVSGLVLGGGRLNAFTNTPFGEDLLSLHAAGQVVTSQPARLYDDATGRRVQAETIGPVGREVYNRYLSPPHTAWLLSPLSRLPFYWTLALWSLLSLAALLAVPFLLGVQRATTMPFVIAALVFAPVLDGFASGQNALFTLVLFACGFRLWAAGHSWSAGFVLALVAIHKPHLLMGPAVLFLLDVRRDPRPLIALLLGTVAIAGIDLLFFPDETRAFLAWGSSVVSGRAPVWSQLRPGGEMTVGAFFQLLLPGSAAAAHWSTWGTQVFAIGAFVVLHRVIHHVLHRVLRQRRALPGDRRPPWADRIVFAAAAVLSLWLTPHAHPYEWTLLLLPAALLWRDDLRRPLLLPVFLIFVALAPLSVRLARLQLSAFGAAVHPSVPLLVLATVVIAVVARTRLLRLSNRTETRA